MTAYDRKHRLEGGGGKVVLYVGDDDDPFPIPLVPDGPMFWIPTPAMTRSSTVGRAKRAATIQVCLAYGRAARNYSRDRGAGSLEFARRLRAPRATGRFYCRHARRGRA